MHVAVQGKLTSRSCAQTFEIAQPFVNTTAAGRHPPDSRVAAEASSGSEERPKLGKSPKASRRSARRRQIRRHLPEAVPLDTSPAAIPTSPVPQGAPEPPTGSDESTNVGVVCRTLTGRCEREVPPIPPQRRRRCGGWAAPSASKWTLRRDLAPKAPLRARGAAQPAAAP